MASFFKRNINFIANLKMWSALKMPKGKARGFTKLYLKSEFTVIS